MKYSKNSLIKSIRPLLDHNVQIFTPLYVDTYPLAFFYDSIAQSVPNQSYVHIIDWDVIHSTVDILMNYIEKFPCVLYTTTLRADAISNVFKRSKRPQIIPISTFKIKRFFARFPSHIPNPKNVSADDFACSVSTAKDDTQCFVHSDNIGLSSLCCDFLKDKIPTIGRKDGTGINLVENITNIEHVNFQTNKVLNGIHVYLYSEIGQRAIMKTINVPDVLQFDFPDEVALDHPENKLKLMVHIPKSMNIENEARILDSLELFHKILFSMTKDQLRLSLKDTSKVFVQLITRKIPILNLFRNSGEYADCFLEHHMCDIMK